MNGLSAQEIPYNYNYTYDSNVRSVRFHISGINLSQPIVYLGARTSPLFLTFDVLGDDAGNYMYRVEHCDADWEPSELETFEYVDGFHYGDIENYDFSISTTINYTNFNITLPNDDTRFTKSGNYLLHVYDSNDEDVYLFTRRFIIVEDVTDIEAATMRPAMVNKMDTHHELNFIVNHKDFDIRNPKREIRASVMQSGIWSTAINDIEPFFLKPDIMQFNYTNKMVFKAGKEWRFVDIRGLQNEGRNIVDIQETNEGYDVTLTPDQPRANRVYLDHRDINGNFVIENIDFRGRYLEADYANVFFTLKDTEYAGKDVYLVGAFSDFKPKEEFKMVYNNRINAYVAQILLKQGFHDYQYATVDRDTKEMSFSEIEGDDYQTESEYTTIVYYRPFGQRYDRIISVAQVNSRR